MAVHSTPAADDRKVNWHSHKLPKKFIVYVLLGKKILSILLGYVYLDQPMHRIFSIKNRGRNFRGAEKVAAWLSRIKWKKRELVWALPIFRKPWGQCWWNQLLWSCATAVGPWQPGDTEGVRHQGTFVLHLNSSSSPGNSSLASYGTKHLWHELLHVCPVCAGCCCWGLRWSLGFISLPHNQFQPDWNWALQPCGWRLHCWLERCGLGCGQLWGNNCGWVTVRKSVVVSLSGSPGDSSIP